MSNDSIRAFNSTGGTFSVDFGPMSPPLRVGSGIGIPSPPAILDSEGNARRLTPIECERLMGWPEGHTSVGNKAFPDNVRYRMCGNGVVSNVAQWVAMRLLVAAPHLVKGEHGC